MHDSKKLCAKKAQYICLLSICCYSNLYIIDTINYKAIPKFHGFFYMCIFLSQILLLMVSNDRSVVFDACNSFSSSVISKHHLL